MKIVIDENDRSDGTIFREIAIAFFEVSSHLPDPYFDYLTDFLLDECKSLRAIPETFLKLVKHDDVVAEFIQQWMRGHIAWDDAIASIWNRSLEIAQSYVNSRPEFTPFSPILSEASAFMATEASLTPPSTISKEAVCGFLVYVRMNLVGTAVYLTAKEKLGNHSGGRS
jgi:hypothetical protein